MALGYHYVLPHAYRKSLRIRWSPAVHKVRAIFTPDIHCTGMFVSSVKVSVAVSTLFLFFSCCISLVVAYHVLCFVCWHMLGLCIALRALECTAHLQNLLCFSVGSYRYYWPNHGHRQLHWVLGQLLWPNFVQHKFKSHCVSHLTLCQLKRQQW